MDQDDKNRLLRMEENIEKLVEKVSHIEGYMQGSNATKKQIHSSTTVICTVVAVGISVAALLIQFI